jgi:hypothetical protein
MRNDDADGPSNRSGSEPSSTAIWPEQDERLPTFLSVIGAICIMLVIVTGGAPFGEVGYGLGYALGATLGIVLGVDIGGGGLSLTRSRMGRTQRRSGWRCGRQREGALRMTSGSAMGAISGFIDFGALGGALAPVGGAAIGSVVSADVSS